MHDAKWTLNAAHLRVPRESPDTKTFTLSHALAKMHNNVSVGDNRIGGYYFVLIIFCIHIAKTSYKALSLENG